MHCCFGGKTSKMASPSRQLLDSEDMKPLLQENPRFKQLLEALQDMMDADGTPYDLAEDLDKENRELHASRRSYLVQQALHDSVVSAVKKGCLVTDETRKRCFLVFQRSMEAADGAHCLQLTPTQSTLGLQPRHLQALDQLQGSKEKEKLVQCLLVPDVECHLHSVCASLVQQREGRGGEGEVENPALLNAKVAQLSTVIHQDVERLEEAEKELESLTCRVKQCTQHYVESLTHTLSSLEALISKHRLGCRAPYDCVTSQWLAAKCQALGLKIEVVHGQVLQDTYSKDHTKAMAEVRRQLDEMNTNLDSRLAAVTATLRSYHSVGREFMQIASEYTQVKAEIENKKWALRELGKVEGRGLAAQSRSSKDS